MYSIGEFSRISGLTIKALRLYHEKGILVPSVVGPGTKYRYYDRGNVERARIIRHLRDLDFGLDEIAEILDGSGGLSDVLVFFEKKRQELSAKIRREQRVVRSLDEIIRFEKEAAMALSEDAFTVREKSVAPVLLAGIRFKGKYSDCGQAFGKIARAMGWNIAGKPFNLYHDDEYKETDADIEACIPIKKPRAVSGMTVREFPGGTCGCLVHKGPYDTIGRSYEKVMAYVKGKGYAVRLPIREIYLKGPGMIFRGNPHNYLTEIQVFVDLPEAKV